MKVFYTLTIAAIIFGAAAIGVMFENFKQLANYKQCYEQPLNKLSQHCQDLLDGE